MLASVLKQKGREKDGWRQGVKEKERDQERGKERQRRREREEVRINPKASHPRCCYGFEEVSSLEDFRRTTGPSEVSLLFQEVKRSCIVV